MVLLVKLNKVLLAFVSTVDEFLCVKQKSSPQGNFAFSRIILPATQAFQMVILKEVKVKEKYLKEKTPLLNLRVVPKFVVL